MSIFSVTHLDMYQKYLRDFLNVLLQIVLSLQAVFNITSNSQSMATKEKNTSTEFGWSCHKCTILVSRERVVCRKLRDSLWQKHPNCAERTEQLRKQASVHFNWSNQVKHTAASLETVKTHYLCSLFMGTSVSPQQLAPKSVGLKHAQTTQSGTHWARILRGPVVGCWSQWIERDGYCARNCILVIHLSHAALSPLVLFYINGIDVGRSWCFLCQDHI